MGTLSGLKEAALESLRKAPELKGAVITDEFPGEGKPQVVTRPILALGYEQIQVKQAGLGGLLDDGSEGKCCEATFLFTLCAPRREVSPRLVGLFDTLAEVLLTGNEFPVTVTSLRCEPVVFDRTLGCPVLRAYAKAEFWMDGKAEEGKKMTDYIVRSVEI